MDEAERRNVGEVVKARRAELDLTQRQAALAADVSDTTWVKVESGQVVGERTYRRIAGPLRWPQKWLDWAKEGKMPPEVDAPRPGTLGAVTSHVTGTFTPDQRTEKRVDRLEQLVVSIAQDLEAVKIVLAQLAQEREQA